jgi:hypothetical protein
VSCDLYGICRREGLLALIRPDSSVSDPTRVLFLRNQCQ